MRTVAIACLGWMATATFVASYFFARPAALRTVQILAALMWVAYGWLIGASPVIAANVLVILAAAWTAARGSQSAAPDTVGRNWAGRRLPGSSLSNASG
jgi:hypothetical protein